MPRILLVRHGRSAHASVGWLDAPGVGRWLASYDEAGLAPGDLPPAPLRAEAERAALVVASDLPRARASAELLAPDAPVVLSPLLREAALDVPALGPVRLPLAGWALCIRAREAYRRMRGVLPPAETRRQGAAAASWLARLAEQHELVLAVTHANVRAHVAAALGRDGWRREPGGGRFTHWSAWGFTRQPAPPPTPSGAARRSRRVRQGMLRE